MTEREFLLAFVAYITLRNLHFDGEGIDNFLDKHHTHYHEVEFILKDSPEETPYRRITHNTTRQRRKRGLDVEGLDNNT